jgi:serine/threonine-protein kinase HipA
VGADSWIIKTPSTIHRNVPENEYSAMKLAEAIGVDIPEIELAPLDSLDKLPEIQLPNESHAYAIRRFDRGPQGRIHTEDFAQIFELYAHDKYGKSNYEQIAATLYRYGANGLEDVQQMARRLLANILLANGDAHLKNWTVIYPDTIHARLSPAYDIVSTLPYVHGENGIALNLGTQNAWYGINLATFQAWSERVGISWPAVKVHVLNALARARETWPQMLQDLPMKESHTAVLKDHWSKLSDDFKFD